MRRYALKVKVDEKECCGCKAYEVACKLEHKASGDKNFININIRESWETKANGSFDLSLGL